MRSVHILDAPYGLSRGFNLSFQSSDTPANRPVICASSPLSATAIVFARTDGEVIRRSFAQRQAALYTVWLRCVSPMNPRSGARLASLLLIYLKPVEIDRFKISANRGYFKSHSMMCSTRLSLSNTRRVCEAFPKYRFDIAYCSVPHKHPLVMMRHPFSSR
jgi:hypothetical protein